MGSGIAHGVRDPARWELLADGGLELEVAQGLLDAIRRWLPFSARATVGAGVPGARIVVDCGCAVPEPVPTSAPILRLGAASAWVDDTTERVRLHDVATGCSGTIDLASRRAELCTADELSNPAAVGWALYSMLNISAAFLLGRVKRALVHAGAVVAPGGSALLLVGDSRAGKSTTCVNLITQGWDYLSDDQVVLREVDARVRVDGWLRTFHLDHGWSAGHPVGDRGDVVPSTLGPGAWRSSAPLGGLLFPRVEADLPTSLLPLSPADALGMLIRQTPWLLSDRGAAPGVLLLLQRTVRYPAYTLRLGLDTYRDAARLAAVLTPALSKAAQ